MPVQRLSLVTTVVEQLRTLILNDYGEGSRLPAETELAATLNVSRSTLREAIGRLWHEGVLQKKWGVGTIVVRRQQERQRGDPVSLPLLKISPGPQQIREMGAEPGVVAVSIGRLQADVHTASLLDVAVEAPVWRVDRVLTADGEPVLRAIDFIPATIKGHVFDATRFDAIRNPIIMMLRDKAGCEIARTEGSLSAVAAHADNAAALGVAEGSPLLLTEQTSYAADGTTVTYAFTWYRPDRTDLRFTRSLQGEPAAALRLAEPSPVRKAKAAALRNASIAQPAAATRATPARASGRRASGIG